MRRGSLIPWIALMLATACGGDDGPVGSPGKAAGVDGDEAHDPGVSVAGGAGSSQTAVVVGASGDDHDPGVSAEGAGASDSGGSVVVGDDPVGSPSAAGLDAGVDERKPNRTAADDAGVESGTGAGFDSTNPGPIRVRLPDLACQASLLSPTAEDSPECDGLTMCTELLCYPQLIGCFLDDSQSGALGGPCRVYAECASSEVDPCAAGCKLDNACLNCFVATLNRCYLNDCAGQFESCIGMPFPTELAAGLTCAEVEPCCATQTDPNLKAMCEGVVAAGLDLNCAGAAAVVCVD